jgi:protein-histidine pros-kinase
MGLTTKFNLILVPVLGLGFAAIGYIAHATLEDNARHEVIEQAALMMGSAAAVRGYTVEEIRPLLSLQIKRQFLPQTVPAYAATQSFIQLQKDHPEYSYKEATLNPTNPRDRALDWEADIISLFHNDPDLEEFVGERLTPNGPSLYLAKPIRITNAACLTCHSTPDAAPDTMIERYGSANGFGWQLDEVVGAQIVSVPMQVPVAKAEQTFRFFMIALAVTFVAILVLINLLLQVSVINPIRRMSRSADAISHGDMQAPEFDNHGKDELATLAASFNRMRRSLEKAFSMLDEKG